MSEPIIRVEGLGKRYRIGIAEPQVTSFREAATSALASPFRYFRTMNRPPTADEMLWALRDISFEVYPGQVVGIIGRNGAGKSTLLKILSRITEPTEGRAVLHGRLGSLLEVGTGFHPDLTGRENVYMNGAILGMRKSEIDRKFDEIINFAEIEKFIDTPVKRYSSGMYVRLAFAVAAHLEPEILVVDEVLAVGDAAFRKKCLERMDVVAKEGRTVLFVSHNVAAISALTDWTILLNHGRIKFIGNTEDAVREYLASGYQNAIEWHADEWTRNPIQLLRAELCSGTGLRSSELTMDDDICVTIEYLVREPIAEAHISLILHASDGAHLFSSEDPDDDLTLLEARTPGNYKTTLCIPGGWLNRGDYYIRIGSGVTGRGAFDNIEALRFSLIDTSNYFNRAHRYRAYLVPRLQWQTERLEQKEYSNVPFTDGILKKSMKRGHESKQAL